PVLGYQTSSLPAFYTRTSSETVDYRLDSAQAMARFLAVKWRLDLNGGVVIANPIPEAAAMPEEIIKTAIETALAEATAQQIHGKASTPFLLARVAELTGGDSLASNIQLVLNNARLAADIAIELAQDAPGL
uniref:pseudouridine-5'-phosphate glycosidase n=1 Tax=Reinekea sp. TaxID=1970455 RepID=UPI00257FF17C